MCDNEWIKKYRNVYGAYFFTQPEIVIADQHLLKKLLVKDFHNFRNRRHIDISKRTLYSKTLPELKDGKWKKTRNAIAPAFTGGKLKGTLHLMENSVNTLCSILDESNDFENGVDVKQVMCNMTMDVVTAAAFAMDVDTQRKPNNQFTKNAKQLISITFNNWRMMVLVVFPWITKKLDEVFNIRMMSPSVEKFFKQNLSVVIKNRRQNSNTEKLDFLQFLINAANNENNEKQDEAEVDATIDHGMTLSKKRTLVDQEIIMAQSFLFLFAGHETTATTISFVCYLLAVHPEAQEKCYEELENIHTTDEPITYTDIQRGMPYLEAVISETLRLYPPAVRFDRTCDNDYQLTDQIIIPKGAIVNVPVYAIHHSAENYEDPEKFDPESVWYRACTLWKRVGVPGPPSWILFGHAIEYTIKGIHACDNEWIKKYGNVYGAYLFTQPEIVIADQHLLKKVLVKDFHNFTNRRIFDMSKKTLFSKMITALKDEEWKNTRNAITPAFTSGKLKGTLHLMENCVNVLCSILDESNDYENGIDVKEVMGNMTMDVIGAAAFAMDANAQRNPNNQFTKHAKQLATISFKNWRMVVVVIFPWMAKKLDEVFNIRLMAPGVEEFYESNLSVVIKNRRQNPNTEKLDFLQLLINAADNEKQDETEVDTTIDHGMTLSKKWTLDDRDIIAQSFLFLFAGHETTATTVTFVCYLLALHPEAQEKCYEELENILTVDEPITYTDIQRGMPYLEAVISETLRLYPPAVRFDRACDNDYQLTDQITIPKGAIVNVPIYAIHHSAENYEDPEKFDPERFLLPAKKSSNPFAYLPFGYGPRNCIGMRFAQLEMKMALGNVLRKFRIEPCSKTEPMPLKMDIASLLRPKNPVRLNFKRR